MSSPQKTPIESRRTPRQARSEQLVAAVLEAAIQVLVEEGAQRFTTARVAARAGVSVGSIYQYFPNKAAILFRLQLDEWQRTAQLLDTVLARNDDPPIARLREFVREFVRSECEEALVRNALSDAAPLYRSLAQPLEARVALDHAFHALIAEVLPRTRAESRWIATDLILATLSSVGKRFSQHPHTPHEIDTYAGAMSDMFVAYLESMHQQG